MREQHGFAKEQPDNQAVSPGSQTSGERPNTLVSPILQRFGNYDLVHCIGRGGMGEVYLARQRTAFGREVAVKIIRPDLMNDITIRKRFLREAEVNAYLKHDHILPLVEFGEEQGRLFLVTPYIKGGTLLKRLRGGALTLSETYELFTALVQAVAYLHKRGVIHRDLKPSNILLDHEEDSQRVYVRLIDFGIASLQGRTVSAPLTTAGHEMGTETYMAPERLDGVAAPSNDIYSLGIILYQMLTGKLPENDADMMLPEPLIEVVEHGTLSDPGQRYASAEELLRAFEHAYKSLSLSHFRLGGSNPDHPPIGRNSSASPPPTAQPQASPSVPARPASNELARKPLVTPSINPQAGVLPNTPSRPPVSSGFNSTNAQHSTPHVGQATTTGGQNVVEPRPRPSQLSNPARLRSEVVLPPLPDRTSPFKGEDYEAPTSYINPESPPKERVVSNQTNRAAPSRKVAPRLPEKKRGLPLVTTISVAILIIFFVIGSIGYSIYQSLNVATIIITPRQETLSTTLNLTAKLGQTNVDINAGVIPAQVLTSAKSDSKSGNTTGKADCTLLVLNCKQAVSVSDVNNLATKLRPTVQDKIQNDIRQQEQGQGATPVGQILYGNETIMTTPQVNTVSNTVMVTLSLQGSQEYIKTSDAREFAKQKLQGQLKLNYTLIDKTVQLSPAAVQSVDGQGTAQITMAAAAVSRYKPTDNDLSNIKKQMAGKSQKDARAIIAQNPDLDANNIGIRLSAGDNLPGTVEQIKINLIEPTTTPPVQVPPIPT